jgi:competence protein ComEC
MKDIRKSVKIIAVFILIVNILFAFGGCSLSAVSNSNVASSVNLTNLSVHVIDVGQGDSIFIYCDGSTMLIDSGIPDEGTKVENYLKSYHIAELNYLVATHPHDDHIGGMPDVINNIKIDKILMTRVTNNTKSYENLLTAISNKGLKITEAKAKSTFTLGGAQCTILAPNASYTDLNDSSIVIKLTYKGKSFLFTGDASEASEADMIKQGYDLKADVLKVGHHGSSTATSAAFLKAVNPQYAVISVGLGNSYGHPAKNTLDKLGKANVKVYRTDKNGTVIFSYDGGNLKVTTEK